MSDREQAIDDVAKHLRCEIDAVIEACKEDELAMEYAVSQRERVIQLERALREIQNREETVEKVRAEKKAAKRGTQ